MSGMLIDVRHLIYGDKWTPEHERKPVSAYLADALTKIRRLKMSVYFMKRERDVFRKRATDQQAELARLRAAPDAAVVGLNAANSAIWSAYADLHSHIYVETSEHKMLKAFNTLSVAYTVIRDTAHPAAPAPTAQPAAVAAETVVYGGPDTHLGWAMRHCNAAQKHLNNGVLISVCQQQQNALVSIIEHLKELQSANDRHADNVYLDIEKAFLGIKGEQS